MFMFSCVTGTLNPLEADAHYQMRLWRLSICCNTALRVGLCDDLYDAAGLGMFASSVSTSALHA